jgi:hypothetical protein
MVQECAARLEAGRVQPVQKILFRLGLGSTRGMGVHIRPIPVSSLLNSARRYLGTHFDANVAELISLYYDPLTDLTHPNFYAMSLSQEDEGLSKVFSLQPDFAEDWIAVAVTPNSFLMEVGGMALDEVLAVSAMHPHRFEVPEPEWISNEIYAENVGKVEQLRQQFDAGNH